VLALLQLAKDSKPRSFVDRVKEAVLRCAPELGFSPTSDRAPPATLAMLQAHTDWTRHLSEGRSRLPHRFAPPILPNPVTHRHPYEGAPTTLSVGEFAVGVGCFMATAIAVGLHGAWMAEHDDEALQLAITNCPSVDTTFGSVFDVDPMDLPWVHVLLGGACCQPFSRIGKQLAWRDDRAYTTLRLLHNVAAMRPWVLVSENVEAQTTIHDGGVWTLITGVLHSLGYTVQPVNVCPSRCLEGFRTNSHVPPKACSGL
jgi:hypothetical protein